MMNISGRSGVCGILADPVEHSMSPVIQNFYGERTGTDMVYVPLKTRAKDLEAAVKGAYAMNFLGMNVTVPHKQHVMEYLAEIDPAAESIGAVNTLVRIKGGFKGYNTDALGFLRTLREAGITVSGSSCILLGAGGAAKAVAYVLASEGAKRVYLLNRSEGRARELAGSINGLTGRDVMIPMAMEDYQKIPNGSYLAVQSTSVGMFPRCGEAPIEDEAFYKKIHTGVDVIYTPLRTRFMELTEAAGGRTVNGLDMLVYQGIAAFELWFPGVKVDGGAVNEARERILDHLGGARRVSSRPKDYVILIGFMGAGKTSVGKVLAERMGCPLLDTDQMIEERAGMSISRIFETKGEEAFRRWETELLEELVEKDGGSGVLSVGGGLPLSQTNRELLDKLGIAVYLKTEPRSVIERLEGDTTRPILAGDNVEAKVTALMAQRGPLYQQVAGLTAPTDGRTPEEIAEWILQNKKGGK